jgi:hypothetical protein
VVTAFLALSAQVAMLQAQPEKQEERVTELERRREARAWAGVAQ